MKICSRPRHHGAVLAGVKAKPFGWPAASPDPGSGGTHWPSSRAAAKFKIKSS
jgi:hypothetical protein